MLIEMRTSAQATNAILELFGADTTPVFKLRHGARRQRKAPEAV